MRYQITRLGAKQIFSTIAIAFTKINLCSKKGDSLCFSWVPAHFHTSIGLLLRDIEFAGKWGLAKVPRQTSGTQIYCLYSPQDMLAFMSCCCWPTSPQLSISCISKNVTLSLRRYHISLKSKTFALLRSWKVQPMLQILVWSTTIPKAEGFSYLLPDTQCRMCWQRTTWEGSLLPVIIAGCILPHVKHYCSSNWCTGNKELSMCHLSDVVALGAHLPRVCLPLSSCLIFLAKGFGTGTCDYFFSL